MTGVTRIARLDALPGDLDALTAESEADGLRFVRKLADEWASGVNRFARDGEALFAAWTDDRLAGVCGLNVDPYTAASGVGRVRHLYVRHDHRGRGIGGALVRAVLEAARGRFQTLRLSTGNPAAARLYETLGFARRDASDCTHVLTLAASPSRTAAS